MPNNNGTFKNLVNLLRRMLGRDQPEFERPGDPYSYVGAPKKPRPPFRSSAAVADPPEQ